MTRGSRIRASSPPRTSTLAEPTPERVQKVLARAGLGLAARLRGADRREPCDDRRCRRRVGRPRRSGAPAPRRRRRAGVDAHRSRLLPPQQAGPRGHHGDRSRRPSHRRRARAADAARPSRRPPRLRLGRPPDPHQRRRPHPPAHPPTVRRREGVPRGGRGPSEPGRHPAPAGGRRPRRRPHRARARSPYRVERGHQRARDHDPRGTQPPGPPHVRRDRPSGPSPGPHSDRPGARSAARSGGVASAHRGEIHGLFTAASATGPGPEATPQ